MPGHTVLIAALSPKSIGARSKTCTMFIKHIGVPGRSNLGGGTLLPEKIFFSKKKKSSKKKFSFLKKSHQKINFHFKKIKKSHQNFGPKFGNFARIFGVLPEFFQNWGGCRPPSPLGKYAYDQACPKSGP